jgi:DNA-nicking Smr family endonuclease
MSRRRLRPDEIALWQQVADRTQRLARDASPPTLPKKPVAEAPPLPKKPRIDPFELGARAAQVKPGHLLQAALAERLGSAPVRMDRKTFGRMTRGKLTPEARIDLHGMTLDRAYPVLSRFILSAQASGKRLVLVITGKGRRGQDDGPIPVPKGILRHQVPQWLSGPPLAQAVLQIVPAHVSHGGEGAYYVYLRRGR